MYLNFTLTVLLFGAGGALGKLSFVILQVLEIGVGHGPQGRSPQLWNYFLAALCCFLQLGCLKPVHPGQLTLRCLWSWMPKSRLGP